jgi:hypothetical protein
MPASLILRIYRSWIEPDGMKILPIKIGISIGFEQC